MLKHITTRVIQFPVTTALRTTRNFHSTTFTMVKQVQGLENFKKGDCLPQSHRRWFLRHLVRPLQDGCSRYREAERDRQGGQLYQGWRLDESPDVAFEYGISAMPTFMFFKNGEKIETVIGANVGKLQASVKALV